MTHFLRGEILNFYKIEGPANLGIAQVRGETGRP